METEKDLPIYDKPISLEEAQCYVANYMENTEFKPADFQGFYFHRDEIQIVLNQNEGKKYIKFTLGMKQLDKEKYGDKLYGCVMMSGSDVNIPEIDLTLEDGNNIYDFSRPIPPHPPTEE
jgi:hypothetical protein